MGRRSPFWELEEQDGGRFSDLETAQRVALAPMAADLAEVLRVLIEAGALVNLGGRLVIPAEVKSADE